MPKQEISKVDIESRTIKMIKDLLPEVKGVELTSKSDLVVQYSLDSLDVVELVMEIETEFNISIEDDKLLKAINENKGVITPSILINLVHQELTK